MEVKSSIINGFLNKEVYVKQPLGFEDVDFANYVYKIDRALYGLKQALRSCSEKEIY